MGIKRILQNRRLSAVKRDQKARFAPSGAISVRTVGLVLYLEDNDQLTLLEKLCWLFFKRGAVCHVCIYIKNKALIKYQPPRKNDWLVLSKEHVNWYGVVRPGLSDAFFKQSFDILINISPKYFFTTSFIAAKAQAKLKIGRYEWPHSPYQLVLGCDQIIKDDDFISLLKKCLAYIKMA